MRVQVEIVIAPHPPELVKEALRAAGENLASAIDTVSVQVCATEPPTAILEFENADQGAIQSSRQDRLDRQALRLGILRGHHGPFSKETVTERPRTGRLTGWYMNCNEGNPLIGGEHDINGNGR